MKQPLFRVYWISILVAIFCTTDAFAQPEYNMSNNTVTDCEGTLYDSGGPNGNYGSEENFAFTICPDPAPVCLRLNMGTVVVEDFFDTIFVYDGVDNTGDSLMFHNSGVQTIESIEASSGCVTIIFNSDFTGNQSGWEINWTCFDTECPEEVLEPTEQDCLGAIPLCLGEYSETNAFVGEGSILNEISTTNTCLLSGERNSVWYTFTVLNSGDLGFTITPNDLGDDYDWAVFNITNASCEDIPIDPSILVSCNFSNDTGVTGATGATSQITTESPSMVENQNALIPVLANETYVINVSQFTTSESGYTINFDASTAVIFDDEPPSLETAALCGSNNLRLKLPENVFCNTVGIEDFTLSGPAGEHTITDITSQACLDGADYDRFFNLLFEPTITVAGQYTLTLIGEVEDLCNNTSNPNNQLVFDITENDIRAPIEDLDVCEGDDLTLVIDNSDPDVVYNFYLDSTLDNLLGSGKQLDVEQYITIQDTPFLFYITEVDSECDNIPTEVSVIVRGLDVADLSYDSPICFDESAPPALPILSAESTQGGMFEITDGATIDAATGEIDISTTSQGATYTITYTTPDPNCSVSVTANVDVVGPPTLSIEGLNSSYSDDTGDIPLTANIADAVFAGPGITTNSNIFNTQAAGIGIHEICATYTDPATGCSTDVCLSVEVFSKPTATFELNSATCVGEEIEITYTGNVASGVFMWNFGDGTQTGGTDANPVVQWDSPGVQTISLTVELDGFSSDEETMDIDLVDIEVPSLTESMTITPGESITLMVDASASNGNELLYDWTPSDDLSCNDCPNPSASPSSFTNYSVLVTDSESGCSETIAFQVNVTRQSRIAIPQAFTPNGDGLNDTYRILIRDFTEAEFQIYDRSGNRVFESQDPTNDGWDGIYENEPQNIGVYVYYLIVTFDNGDRRLYQGNITLIR